MQFEQDFLRRPDGERIGLQTYPEPPGADTLAVIWPAMGVPARYYRPFAALLHDAGLAVVVADLRGTGTSTPPPSRSSRYGYSELVDDVGAVLEALKSRRDGRRTVLIGHSLGGQACALWLALNQPSDVDGLALIAVGMPYWRVYPGARKFAILPATQIIHATSVIWRMWPGWGFGGRQARPVIADWAYTARHGRYRPVDGRDAEAALARMTTPVLAVSVDGDAFTPPSGMDRLTGKMTAATVVREHYTTAEADAPLDHFKWVRAAAPLAARVAAWSRLLGRPE